MKNIWFKCTKIALIAATTVSTTGLFAIAIDVFNHLNGSVRIKIDQAVCPSFEETIPANGYKRILTPCCVTRFNAYAMSGSRTGAEASINPYSTGLDMNCGIYYRVEIKEAANNAITLNYSR